MTAQIPDTLTLDGIEYALAGIDGEQPFDPAEFGLNPVGRCTACYRGYVCGYRLHDGTLRLDRLRLTHQAELPPGVRQPPGPPLNGISPKRPPRGMLDFNCQYEGLNLALPFSGGLLLGRDFVPELYVHMGFHPAWKYREVVELHFVDGVLAQREDRSAAMAQFRATLAPGQRIVPSRDFIASAFSREYKI
ncbi:hypothetical protein [Chitinimonas lacunae]|uniref:Uncharacterized protein n=1 Tax=Chitinimonas lacunae TaxID=1963018 RepID=A0ABV8MUA4_9NEIS